MHILQEQRSLLVAFFYLALPAALSAQTATLSLGCGSTTAGGTISLPLSLYGAARPAAVQWMFSYSSSDIAGVTVTDGPVATAAGAPGAGAACRSAGRDDGGGQARRASGVGEGDPCRQGARPGGRGCESIGQLKLVQLIVAVQSHIQLMDT